MPYCRECGKEIPEDAAYCLYCGVQVPSKAPKKRKKEEFETTLIAQPRELTPYLLRTVEGKPEFSYEEKAAQFTDVGKAAWDAVKQLDKGAVIGLLSVEPVETAWTITSETGEPESAQVGMEITDILHVRLALFKYKGWVDEPHNYVMCLFIIGNRSTAKKFAKALVKNLGYNPWEGLDAKEITKFFYEKTIGVPSTFLGFDILPKIQFRASAHEIKTAWQDLL